MFAVPYGVITKNAAGESIILVARPQENGRYLVEEVPVTRGLEAERFVQISSAQLAEGDLVVATILGVHKGDSIAVNVLSGALQEPVKEPELSQDEAEELPGGTSEAEMLQYSVPTPANSESVA